jgi:hypothetical protein
MRSEVLRTLSCIVTMDNLFSTSLTPTHYIPSLRYVLLFPTGQLGWYLNILYATIEDEDAPTDLKHKHVSMAEFHCYCLFTCTTGSNHIFLTCNLFQEFVCETWAVSEQNSLHWLRKNQSQLCAEVYKGLVDAVAADVDANLNQLGTRFILPSSFTGSTHHMQQLCQDALAINRYFGGGDLFITMTANPAWPEIKSALFPGQSPSDHPDLVIHVFKQAPVPYKGDHRWCTGCC